MGRPTRSATRIWWLLALVVVVIVGAGLEWRAGGSALVAPLEPVLSAGTGVTAVARRETRPTLDPGGFVGKAALAHRVAREIPDTLDQLYCYCECDKHAGHKSLLSCYTDGHAAT
jgi:hypothetical protein